MGRWVGQRPGSIALIWTKHTWGRRRGGRGALKLTGWRCWWWINFRLAVVNSTLSMNCKRHKKTLKLADLFNLPMESISM